MKVKTVS